MLNKELNNKLEEGYRYGFESDINQYIQKPGLSSQVIKNLSTAKKEPGWLLDFRLKSYRYWRKQKEPNWANLNYPPIDYQKISYYATPKKKNNFTSKEKVNSLDEVDPEILKTFDRLGISLSEQKRLTGVAVDAVLDSVSVKTTFQKELKEKGIIFCSFSEAVQNYPELVKKYLGSVVPFSDNFFASLNSAVFTDGSFAYIPPNTKCPMELSTYFRINAKGTGQFERTLIICDKNSYVSYLEGCTAPQRDENQLHAAVVELIALENAEIKYSTVQNWYPGDINGKGGVYNFVTKRGICKEKNSKISWTQVETGSSITWKYPSVILKGDESSGEFYSIALTKDYQQADTGTKMIHIGKNTKSKIISKGISAGHSKNCYRGLVQINKNASGSKNFTQCDSLILSNTSVANTLPKIRVKNQNSSVEHEAWTSKLSQEMMFYLNSRGFTQEEAQSLLVSGFTKEIMDKLPMEFAVEAKNLLEMKLEGSIG
jgi:Fe-S cluster assembly protein SufB